jgi:hypothetical protein
MIGQCRKRAVLRILSNLTPQVCYLKSFQMVKVLIILVSV